MLCRTEYQIHRGWSIETLPLFTTHPLWFFLGNPHLMICILYYVHLMLVSRLNVVRAMNYAPSVILQEYMYGSLFNGLIAAVAGMYTTLYLPALYAVRNKFRYVRYYFQPPRYYGGVLHPMSYVLLVIGSFVAAMSCSVPFGALHIVLLFRFPTIHYMILDRMNEDGELF
jgi:hypothetical protein